MANNGTTGHETEAINVQDLKASLQKFKTDKVDPKVTEGYYYNKKFYKEAAHTTEITGADGRIYIDKDTNREYRFDGTKYVLLKSEVDGSFVNEGTFTYRPTAGALDVESGAVGEGGAQIECVKGNTIAWSQLYNLTDYTYAGMQIKNEGHVNSINGTATGGGNIDINISIVQGHKYYVSLYMSEVTSSMYPQIWLNVNDGNTRWNKNSQGRYIFASNDTVRTSLRNIHWTDSAVADNIKFTTYCIDLTLIYGEGNEPTTPEQFEADYQKWFGKPLTYEEYDEGSLRSVEMTGIKTVGFNQWDEEREGGYYDTVTGMKMYGDANFRSKNYITVLPLTKYHYSLNREDKISSAMDVMYYDANHNYISKITFGAVERNKQGEFTTPQDCYYITLSFWGYQSNWGTNVPTWKICINLSHSGDRNGDYEPYWEHTASLPVTQLKGKLNGEGESVVIFPDGMKKAGTVYDEIVKRGNQTVAIKRIGQVDLGSLTWLTMHANVFFTGVVGAKINYAPMLCSRYQFVEKNPTDSTFVSKDFSNLLYYKDYNIYFKDTDYSDAATFKAAMQGVILYYELETPQEYIIDDIDFPTEYPVDDYGTEEILSDSAKSLAPTLDIRYGLNATDTLRNLPSKYVSAVEEQNFTEAQKERARVNIGAAGEDVNIAINALTRHTRLTDFDLNVLKQAVADQNLEKYGLKVGDEKTINGHTYVIAGLNTMKGTLTPYRLNKNHVGLIAIPHTTQAWNVSGKTNEGADSRGAGYINCDLHYYLKHTLLPLVETDLGAGNLLGHNKPMTNAVNVNGYNRYGSPSGCSSSWLWEANCKIVALSEVQVYGSTIWSSSGMDTGEAVRQLDVFRVYNHTEIFGNESIWLRDVASTADAASTANGGQADCVVASSARYVAALVLFN